MDIIAIVCVILLVLLVLSGAKITVLLGMLGSWALGIAIVLLVIGIFFELCIIAEDNSLSEKIGRSIGHSILTLIIVFGSYWFFRNLVSVDTSGGLSGLFGNFLQSIGALIGLCIYACVMMCLYTADMSVVGLE